jgi:hypothetical protein
VPVLSCSCVNSHQDAIHGVGKRVMNPTAKKDPPEYRCTSCGSTRNKGGNIDTKKKKK